MQQLAYMDCLLPDNMIWTEIKYIMLDTIYSEWCETVTFCQVGHQNCPVRFHKTSLSWLKHGGYINYAGTSINSFTIEVSGGQHILIYLG